VTTIFWLPKTLPPPTGTLEVEPSEVPEDAAAEDEALLGAAEASGVEPAEVGIDEGVDAVDEAPAGGAPDEAVSDDPLLPQPVSVPPRPTAPSANAPRSNERRAQQAVSPISDSAGTATLCSWVMSDNLPDLKNRR
jgi:hypothetical protein